jgi:CheY-like chemotaxis protein
VVEEVLRMLKRTFPKTIEFRTKLDPGTPRILADSGQLYQVLLNLSVNARDVMPEGGVLKFSCKCVSAETVRAKFSDAQAIDHACLTVTDTGAGMDEKTRQRIFEPFFTTKAAGQGTGLGLAVVYGVVQSHRGFIEVESAPGQGTTFRLYFPAAAVESVADTYGAPEPESAGGTETLLLVEDENLYRDLITSILEQRGYRVLTASDGAAALKLFRERAEEIDLVVSDLSLPQLSGTQLVNQILALKPQQKVLICSGYIEPPLRARLKELGVMEFLIKPYRPMELLSRIRNLLDGAASTQLAGASA